MKNYTLKFLLLLATLCQGLAAHAQQPTTLNSYTYEGRSSSPVSSAEQGGSCPSCYGGVDPGGTATYVENTGYSSNNYCIVSKSAAAGLVSLATWAGSSNNAAPNNGNSSPIVSTSDCLRQASMSGDGFFVARTRLESIPPATPTVVVWQTRVYLRAGEQYALDADVRDLLMNTSGPRPVGGFNGRATGVTAQWCVTPDNNASAQFGSQLYAPGGKLVMDYSCTADGYYVLAIRVKRDPNWTVPTYNDQPSPPAASGTFLEAFVGIDNVVIRNAGRLAASNLFLCESTSATVKLSTFDTSASVDYLWYTSPTASPAATTKAGSYSAASPPSFNVSGLPYGTSTVYVLARIPGVNGGPTHNTALVPVSIYRTQSKQVVWNSYTYEGRSSSPVSSAEQGGSCPSCYGGVDPGGTATYVENTGYSSNNYCIVSKSAAAGLVSLATWAGSSNNAAPNNGNSSPIVSTSDCLRQASMSGDGFFVARTRLESIPPATPTVVVWQTRVYLRAGEQYALNADVRDLLMNTSGPRPVGGFNGRATGVTAQWCVTPDNNASAQFGSQLYAPGGRLVMNYTPPHRRVLRARHSRQARPELDGAHLQRPAFAPRRLRHLPRSLRWH